MVTLGWIFFFCILFMAMWILMFLFVVVVPGAIQVFFLNKLMPKYFREMAGLEEEE